MSREMMKDGKWASSQWINHLLLYHTQLGVTEKAIFSKSKKLTLTCVYLSVGYAQARQNVYIFIQVGCRRRRVNGVVIADAAGLDKGQWPT